MGATNASADILETLKEKYEPVIGLEVHVQLLTRSKIFCGCSTRFGDPPNTNTCPVCLGLPGALPVLNREAVAKGVKAALALNCRVNRLSRFARKNYFYPDLPKGYQISQFDQPLAEHGWIIIHAGGPASRESHEGPKGPEKKVQKRIGITRLHLEEDAGKSIHDGFPDSNEKTYVDLNRAGVPLGEIVSEPDMRSPEEAYDYVTRLRQILLYLGVSDCNMEEGSLRCDANVSVRPRGQKELGVKTEVKNLNSFRFLQKALEYEIGRQVRVLEDGGKIEQETRLWNPQTQRTMGMRSKEHAHDYRYFPEPDLLPLMVSEEMEEEIRRTIPELPEAKRRRFIEQFKLSEYDTEVLTATQELAGYYEQAAAKASGAQAAQHYKTAANWVMVELLGALNAAGKAISESPVSPDALAGLLALIEDGTVSGKMAKSVFEKMFATGKSARDVVDELGLKQITDDGQIREIIQKAIAANPKQLEQYRAGKTTLLGFFVGQVMRETKGQANPQKVNELLKGILSEGSADLKQRHERAVADSFFTRYNEKHSTAFAFVRFGNPPEPDLIYRDKDTNREIGIEVTSTYLNKSEAKWLWDHARKKPGTAQQWTSGNIQGPDDTYANRLLDALLAKLQKTYSGSAPWLLVDFNYTLGDETDAKRISTAVAGKLSDKKSPFAEIWAVWQVTNVLTAQYEIFRLA